MVVSSSRKCFSLRSRNARCAARFCAFRSAGDAGLGLRPGFLRTLTGGSVVVFLVFDGDSGCCGDVLVVLVLISVVAEGELLDDVVLSGEE